MLRPPQDQEDTLTLGRQIARHVLGICAWHDCRFCRGNIPETVPCTICGAQIGLETNWRRHKARHNIPQYCSHACQLAKRYGGVAPESPPG